ncbi:alpha/beta hydrolase [Paenibacillus sambharensis]|uniref:alpha/beta hydrolase n=1 Tax=Paenibacillus sambharensis TaxID=1803190 RepID=UPI0015E8EAA9|nr:alpha/beta fold hydrolase [Paenibacillus sambharensis]
MWHQFRFGTGMRLAAVEEYTSAERTEQPLIITLAGLGQAMSEKNYLFSNLRKRLAEHNQWVVQFDYMGHGDSAGLLEEATIASMIDDTLAALKTFTAKRKPGRIYMIGHALGAVVAQSAALAWEQQTGQTCIPVLLSPLIGPIPAAKDVLDPGALALFDREEAVDTRLLFPGSDYYTLSDFNEEQYRYMQRLGAHPLYLHGQCLGRALLSELDQLVPEELYSRNRHGLHVICGQRDSMTASLAARLPRSTLHLLKDVHYYHQHPASMDEAIDIIQTITMPTLTESSPGRGTSVDG